MGGGGAVKRLASLGILVTGLAFEIYQHSSRLRLDPRAGGPYPNLRDPNLNGWSRAQIRRLLERAEARLDLLEADVALGIDVYGYLPLPARARLGGRAGGAGDDEIEELNRLFGFLRELELGHSSGRVEASGTTDGRGGNGKDDDKWFGRNATVRMDDADLVGFLRSKIPRVDLERTSTWRSHCVPRPAESSWNELAAPELRPCRKPGGERELEQTQHWRRRPDLADHPLPARFFADVARSSADVTFLEIGGGYGHGCLSRLIQDLFPAWQWRGFVVEMDPFSVSAASAPLSLVIPLCVSPVSRPVRLVKKTLFVPPGPMASLWALLRGEPSPGMVHIAGSATVVPSSAPSRAMLRELQAAAVGAGLGSMTTMTMMSVVPVWCYPLYSVMLAVNLTAVDLLSIDVGALSRQVAETLPWSELDVRPRMVVSVSFCAAAAAAAAVLGSRVSWRRSSSPPPVPVRVQVLKRGMWDDVVSADADAGAGVRCRGGGEPPLVKIGPSILNADLGRLADECARMMDCGADYLHLDVMDGHFVPNLTFGHPVVKCLRSRVPDAFFDVHMMVANPEKWVEPMRDAGADQYTFHYEATADAVALARRVKEAGMRVGVALKPGTRVLEPVLALLDEDHEGGVGLVDVVLVMTVEPGFGGQQFMADMMGKVAAVRARGRPGLDVEVDGGVGPGNVDVVAEAGANLIVSGTAVIQSQDPAQTIRHMRAVAQDIINKGTLDR